MILVVGLISSGGAGCAKLAHLQELLTLQGFSQDRDGQDLYTERQNENFEKLLAVAKNNSLGQFSSRRSILRAFGKPILKSRVLRDDGQTQERWLYRYPARPFGSPKVYVYFDKKGKLIEWQYLPRDANDSPETLPSRDSTDVTGAGPINKTK